MKTLITAATVAAIIVPALSLSGGQAMAHEQYTARDGTPYWVCGPGTCTRFGGKQAWQVSFCQRRPICSDAGNSRSNTGSGSQKK